MTKVTKTSTKDVIYNAYQEALKELEAIKATKFDPNAEKKAKETQATLENAKNIVEMNILNEEIVAKYKDLEKAIEIKKTELNEYYGIEKEVDSILALIEAKKAIEAELDCEYAVKENDWQNKIADLKNEYTETAASLKKERQREEEEYAYNLKRTRQVENDKWADEKAKREAELAARESEVVLREEICTKQEAAFEESQKIIAEIPNTIKAAEEKGAEAARKELAKEHAIEKSVIEREAKLEKTLLEKELEALKEANRRLETQNADLAAKLETAQERVQTIATESVKAAQPRIMESASK